MILLQAFKYELRPNGEQTRWMRRFAGACRYVYNKGLALQQALHTAGEKKLGYAGLCKALTGWKTDAASLWLADMPSQALQQALKDLERAYTNFFEKRAAFPQRKKKGRHDSFRYPQGCTIDQANSRVFLPKLGWIRYRNSRQALGVIKNVTISYSGGKWFMSVQTEREVPDSVAAGPSVGIDVGITRFATQSDGIFLDPLDSFKKKEAQLARAQRALCRKVKFSNNWKKEKGHVAKIHTDIANARRDYLHKATTTICKTHAVVCIEDLQVKNMSRSAAGTAAAPGRNVAAKSGLNKAILDQGWGEFRRQLEYKTAWAGGRLIAVPPQNTSRTCPCCGHIAAENRKTQAAFRCVLCGFEANADIVGAMNILSRGIKMLRDEGQDTVGAPTRRKTAAQIVCGDTLPEVRVMAQKPTEVTTHEHAHA